MAWGEKLRTAREEQGLSIEAVEKQTEIRSIYLEALENEDYSLLPPRVYAQGFVKNYARFLGLNSEKLVEEFGEMAYPQDNTNTEVEVVPHQLKTKTRKISIKNVLAASIFLVAALFLGRFLVEYIAEVNSDKNVSLNNQQIDEPGDNNSDQLPNSTPDEPETTPNNDTSDVDNQGVVITAQEDCWLYVSMDGNRIFQGILQAGETKDFTGQGLLYVKAGNAGGIEVTYEGKKIGRLGKQNEVVEKEFNLNNN